jgi:uncharacterized membrane protein YphA (DoxX/SURF4 family)
MLALRIAISVLMALAGGAKLAAAKPIVEQFEEFGLPRALMYLVGVLELAAGVGVHVDALSFWASTGLAALMVGAVGNHVKVGHPVTQTLPSAVVLALALTHSVLTWQ